MAGRGTMGWGFGRGAGSVLVAVALLAGCAPAEQPAGRGSSTLAQVGGDVYAVNVDEGTVSRIAEDGTVTTSAVLGREPTRITAAGHRLWVTLRADGEVAILDRDTLSLEKKVPVGAEPYGAVATADGSRVYVAVSLEDEVVELDGPTGRELRTFPVAHEPRWLALNPSETTLFVAAHRSGGEITAIDLETGRSRTYEAPPTGQGHGHGSDGVIVSDGPGVIPHDLTPRNTGDLVVSDDGSTLAVPTLYVDNTTPVTTVDDPSSGGGGGYGGDTGADVGRINPALVTWSIDGSGDLSDGRPVFLGVNARRNGGEFVRSYPNAAVSDPTGRWFAVSMEGSDAVLVVDTEPFPGQSEDQPRRRNRGSVSARAPSLLGFWDRPVTMIATDGAAPRGLALVGDDLVLHTFLDRRIETVSWAEATAANRHEADDKEGEEPSFPVRSHPKVRELVASALDREVDRGRRLFLSARNPDMQVKGSGISCGTCHSDGRDDALTWTFAEGEGEVSLQTPSLAGPVNDTAPLTWRSPVATVADEALLTTTLRMGGHGPSADDLLAIEAFVTQSRLPVLPPVDEALVAQGRALFEREDVGCASCHAGDRLTDGAHYRIVGEVAANTPGLRGIAASAPYLHDGSLPDLRAVLEWARSGKMGDTSMLSDQELDALEVYLRSL